MEKQGTKPEKSFGRIEGHCLMGGAETNIYSPRRTPRKESRQVKAGTLKRTEHLEAFQSFQIVVPESGGLKRCAPVGLKKICIKKKEAEEAVCVQRRLGLTPRGQGGSERLVLYLSGSNGKQIIKQEGIEEREARRRKGEVIVMSSQNSSRPHEKMFDPRQGEEDKVADQK